MDNKVLWAGTKNACLHNWTPERPMFLLIYGSTVLGFYDSIIIYNNMLMVLQQGPDILPAKINIQVSVNAEWVLNIASARSIQMIFIAVT